jgi:antitoxin (DNA-binding transcriptional repressor) of toxin-antitoxin stability system
MTTVPIEEFRAHLDKYLADAAKHEVVLTQQGKPWPVLRAIASEGEDDSAAFVHSPEFWEMIRQRRQEQGIPWVEAQKELGLEKAKTGS